jgi:hypothetical protein
MLIVAGLWLALPATALAHTGGRISSDYQARIDGLRPPRAGVRARVLESDQRLELTVAPTHVVVVLGVLGEPFLRFSSAGVDVNAASPTAWNSGIVGPADAAPAGRPSWRRAGGGHAYTWHESRLRPRTIVPAGGGGPRRVAAWSIPMLVDGRRADLVGSEWYAPAPSVVPWIVLCAALVAAGVTAARLGGRRVHRAVAAATLPAVVAAWLAGWIGILLYDGPSGGVVVAVAAGYAAVTVLVVGAAVTATSGNGRLVAAGVVGALAAVFTMPEVEAFTAGFVLSALPADAARAVAAVSFAGGIGLAAVCVPAMLEILSDDPLRRRLLAPDGGGDRSPSSRL